jgi:hypothetical protein
MENERWMTFWGRLEQHGIWVFEDVKHSAYLEFVYYWEVRSLESSTLRNNLRTSGLITSVSLLPSKGG